MSTTPSTITTPLPNRQDVRQSWLRRCLTARSPGRKTWWRSGKFMLFVGAFLGWLLPPSQTLAQGPISEPAVSKQMEHPSNTPVAALFGGSYVDSTDDPRTGVSAHNGNNVDLAIGEQFNYIVTVSYPEGTTNDTFFIDQASPFTQIPAFDDTVIELLSAEVIHVGSNLSGGLPPLGFLTLRDLGDEDGDGSQFQYGSGTTDVVNTADGVTDDKDRVVIRVRARLDDEDASGGPADDLPTANNINGRDASNRVQITWNFGADTQQRNSFGTVDIVEPAVNLTKNTISGTDLRPGDTATFELIIRNSGTAPAYNIGVTDTLPNNWVSSFLAFAGLDSANSTCDEQSGFAVNSGAAPNVVFSFNELAAGASCIVRFNTTVLATVSPGETYTNSATVTTFDSRDNASNADNRNYSGGSDTSVVSTVAVDLQLSKDDSGVTAEPGETIIYTLTYTNAGGQGATGVVIAETVPANTTFNAAASTAGWSCAPNNQAGSTCTLAVGTVTSGNGGTATFAVEVDLPLLSGVTQISNAATIGDDGSNGADQNPGDNSANDTTPVEAAPDMQIDKDDRGRIAEPGETILYSLAITNTGSQNATGVVMTDTVPANTTFNAGASSAGWSCANGAPAGTPCAFDLSAVIGGQFDGDDDLVVLATFAVDVVDPVPPGVTQIDNTIVVSDDGSNGPDQNPSDNSHSETTPLDIPGTIIIQKVTDPATFGIPLPRPDVFTFTHNISTPTTFTLERGQVQTFTNVPLGVYTVTEDDPIPAGFDLTGLSCDDANSSSNLGSRTATITLDSNETVTCVFTNTQRGDIRIIKVSDPVTPTDFTFSGALGSFTLDDANPDDGDGNNNRIDFFDLPTGVYTVTENLPGDGYALSSIVCDDPSSPTPSTVDLSNRSAIIQLDPAEYVICTFTNRGPPPPANDLVYLPLISKSFASGPDLVVDEVMVTANTVAVTIRNQGNAPVVDAFWVDLYFNPSKVPEINEPWDTIASQGIAWGLVGSDLPIEPGQTRILTLANAVPGEDLTSPPPYPVGATVYVLVDALDFSTTYGAVEETNETNNLAQSTVAAASSSDALAQPVTTGQISALEALPLRR